ncbi:MAG TPA: histidine triad nucleotide-binding protein [Blastocatellia bacterium]|nr:histidine triad nucleotide-binding protein [Blastocatellia bacterium]
MEDDCLFCKIVAGDVPATLVHSDDKAIAFEDINPQAPHHVLIVPREHMDSLNDVSKGDETLVGHLFRIAAQIADQRGIGEGGFRTVINTGSEAGQSVPHLHVHLLGGRSLAWPPG